jgi:hypothetical protein
LVEPLVECVVYVPGVIAMVVALFVDQLSVPAEPDAMVAGLALKELMTGRFATPMVTVAVATVEPMALVAVSV